MALTTLLIALSMSLYSHQTRSVSRWLWTSSERTMAVGAGFSIVSVGPMFTGNTNGSVFMIFYVAGGAAKMRYPKFQSPKLLCTDAAHALR